MAKKSFALANNPLVNPPSLPHGAPALDKIKLEHFEPAFIWAVEKARRNIAAIVNRKARPTFANTIEALETAQDDYGRISAVYAHFASHYSSDELRKVQQKLMPVLSEFGNEVMFNDALFAKIKQVHDNAANLKLTGEQQILLEDTYNGFAGNGALLSAPERKRLADISMEMSKLKLAYSTNVLKATESWQKIITDENDLAGVPERAKNLYRAAADKAGLKDSWLIKLQPSPADILSHGENRALREEVWRAMTGVGSAPPHDNRPVALEIVKLRDEKAKLLGHANHAEYTLSGRMAENAKTVEDFLARNLAVYRPAAEKEMDEIRKFAQQHDGTAQLRPWDVSYYDRLHTEKLFDLDVEELRPYFDLDQVLKGCFTHAEKLFDITFRPANGTYPVAGAEEKVYEVFDNKNPKKPIGVFYTDYYARPGMKQGGAWMSQFRGRGVDASGANRIPLITNTCNFDKPLPGQPSLLSLDEVRTVFHEFGHGLHGLLAEGNYPSLTGTNVKWDFVELPSQLMENWAGEKEVLDTFARHYKTGKQIPADLIDKARKLNAHGAGMAGLRQTQLALLDIAWHTADPAAIADTESFEDAVMAKTSSAKRESGPMSARFGHIFTGGYSAGYYSYKWAEVLDADVFERFREKGLYDKKTALSVRFNIYAKGGTEQPMTLFRNVMGRDPDPDAMFRREGLAPEAKPAAAPRRPKKPGPGARPA
jgi:peptidyl-dipeptidase Dcp